MILFKVYFLKKMTNQYELTEIEWDIDDDDIKLPSTVFVSAKSKNDAIRQVSKIYGWAIKFAVIELI
jgi:hypothetical protein